MAILVNTAEGGTNGTTVTAGSGGNSGGASGNYLQNVNGTAGTITFSNAQANNGILSYSLAPAAATSTNIGWITGTAQLSLRVYAYFTGAPTAATQFIQFYSSNIATDIALTTTGSNMTFFIQASGTVYTSSVALPLNTWLRFELAVAAATVGYINMAVYNGDSMTPLDSFVSYTANTLTANIASVLIGKTSASGNWATFYLDDLSVDNATTNLLGPSGQGLITNAASITNLNTIRS